MEPLKGIRLPDLYESDDYRSWESNPVNKQLIDRELKTDPFSDPQIVRGHLYINSKIKSDFGEEMFNSLPENAKLKDKVDWYNDNILLGESADTQEAPQNPFVQDDTTNVSGFQNTRPPVDEGDIVPTSDNGHAMWDWFKERSDGAADRMYYQFVEANKPKSSEIDVVDPLSGKVQPVRASDGVIRSYQALDKMREEHPENIAGIKMLENSLNAAIEKQKEDEEVAAQKAEDDVNDFRLVFDNVNDSRYLHVNRELWGSAKTNNTIDDLSLELRDKMEADPQFAFSAFEQFDRLSYEMISQYRNYHDTEAMPITPNEMKDLMAQYYAIRTIKNLNEANNFAQKQLQHVIASHQSILKKADVALQQAGVYFTGNTAAVMGIVANTPNAIAWASREDMDIEDLGNFKEFLFYTTQNPLTQWANDLQSTGTWLPGAQRAAKEQEYNRLQLQRELGNESKILDINTPFELFSQGAYTVAGMFTGSIAAQLLNTAIGRPAAQLATRILSREAAGLGTRFAARAINALGNAVAAGATAYLPAAAEASMDAMEKYNLAKDSAEQDVLTGLEKELQADLEDGTFEEWYNRNSRIPLMMPPAEGWAPGELERQTELRNQERAYLWDQYRTMKAQQVLDDPETKQAIENLAFRTGAKTMFDEATWIAFGDTFFSNILGKSFKELKKGVVRAVTGKAHTPYNWVPEGNYYKAVPKPITWWDKTKAVGKGLVEAGEEGLEELFQTVDSQMREDIAHNYIAEYIANRYDPDAAGQLSDSLRENWDIAKQSIGENVFSEEALYSFFLGAVSAGLGSPTVLRGIKSTIDKKAKGQPWSIRDFWRNPIAENLQELKIKEIQDADEAADINRWLQQHPEISTYNDETAILKFLAQQEDAAARDDEVTYRDALMGQKVATMLMMNRVRPNGMKLNLNARLRAISKLDASSPEARAIVDQMLQGDDSVPRTTEGPLNEEEIEVLNKAKKRAQEDINTYKNVNAQMAILDSQFGNSISTEAKEALAYGLIMRGNWGKRIDEIIKNATDSYNQANSENQVAPISQEEAAVKNAIARYGNLKAVEDEYKALMARRNAIRANKKNMYKQEYKIELEKTAQQIRENRAAKRELNKQDLPVISANEILSLSNKARAYLLDDANRENYSEAQRAEIDKFITSEGVNDQIITDLKDAGRLENKANYFVSQYNELSKNNGALVPLFDREVRAKASEKWSRAKLGNVLEATTYEQFRDELDKALATGEFTSSDRMQFSRIFNDPSNPNKDTSKFYNQYRKEEIGRAQIRNIIQNSPEYQKLTDGGKKAVTDIVSQQQLEGEEITAKNIINRLNDPKFVEQLAGEDLEALAEAINKIMQQRDTYYKNLKAVQETKKEIKETTPETKAPQEPSPDPKKDTIIKQNKYNRNKEVVNRIFGKISNIFTRKNSPQLTKGEFITFLGLYTDDSLTENILGGEFSTEISLDNFYKILRQIKTALENNAYLNDNVTEDDEYQNTAKVGSVIESIIGIIEFSKKTKNPKDLHQFIMDSITEIAPEFKPAFKMPDKSLKKLLDKTELGSKAESGLTTETEKKWYKDNNVSENLAKVAALGAHTLNYIFAKDSGLAESLREELKVDALDSDNFPVAVYAQVQKGTPGAVLLKDNHFYLPIGLLKDSRDIPALESVNGLNAVRERIMQQEQDGPLEDKKGKVYIYEGGGINYAAPAPTDLPDGADSIRDKLLAKHKGDTKAAFDEFKSHVAILNATINHTTGEAYGTVTWNGKDFPIRFPSTVEADKYTYLLYMDEGPNGKVTPTLLFVREFDKFRFNQEATVTTTEEDGTESTENVNNVFDALTKLDLTDNTIRSIEELEFLTEPVTSLVNIIGNRASTLQNERDSAKAAAAITKLLSEKLQKSFNLKRKAKQKVGEISVSLAVENGELIFKATDSYSEEEHEAIPNPDLSRIKLSDLSDKSKLVEFVQLGLRNLIFDEDGNIRATETENGTKIPIIKLQDNYRQNMESLERVFNRRVTRGLFLGDAWRLHPEQISVAPESISVNPTVQTGLTSVSKTGDVVQDAINAITRPEFIDKNEGKHYQIGPNDIEVTTFIRGVEDPNLGSVTGQFATNLGTSIDKLYRVWSKSKDPKAIREYMDKNGIGAWVGIGKQDLPAMVNQFKRIDAFFANRGEIPISQDLKFEVTVVINGKSKTLIGKPDIITVDKQGKYHIYDMKSFRYEPGVSTKVKGFRNPEFIIRGLKNYSKHEDTWRKQTSLYKTMIETLLGQGTVSNTIGIIPVRLDYNPEGGKVSEKEVEGIGAKKLYNADGTSVNVKFTTVPLERTPEGRPETTTRCYDDAIALPAIQDITQINPEGWKEVSVADKINQNLSAVRNNPNEAKKVKEEPPVTPEIIPEVKINKPLSATSQNELAAELGAEKETLTNEEQNALEELIQKNECEFGDIGGFDF